MIKTLEALNWFWYKGDEICWDGNKYFSTLCNGYFSTLEEMDEFWEDVYKENEKYLQLQ